MSRYIDADELKKHKRYAREFNENVVSVAEIDWQPTADVVKVVRCKDCIYGERSKYKGDFAIYCEDTGCMNNDDDFCSRGKAWGT